MQLEPGDIAACYGTDPASRFISGITASIFAPQRLRIGPSHVAMACRWQDDLLWVESTTLCPHPCYLKDELTSGPQAHLPEERIADYLSRGGHVDLYRLAPLSKLTGDESQLLAELLIREFVLPHRPYDLGGALLSGTRLFQLTNLFPNADLQSLFCSELIAAVLMRLNRMNHSNPGRFNPARLLRQLVRCGKYEYVHTFAE